MKDQSTILPAETAETRKARVQRIAEFLARLPVEKPWEMIVRPYRRNRSSQQNRALWGLAYRLISEHTGYETEELHEYYLGTFFGWEVRTLFGQKKRVPIKRSSRLTTEEFARYFDFIQRHAAQNLGLYIPNPDKEWWAQQGREAA